MEERIRAALRDIGALRTIMDEGLDPDPRKSAGPLIVRAAHAENTLAHLYSVGIKIFGKGRWTDQQYAIASAWYRAEKFLKKFLDYMDSWYPPGTYEYREMQEHLEKLWNQSQQELTCQTSPSTPSST